MAAYEKDKGRSLFEKLIDLYLEYGFFKEHLISITKKGMDGQQQIADMMQRFRVSPPASLAGSEVVQLLDYEKQEGRNFSTGEQWKIKLPKSNVLQFILADGSKISARPSGTEPKIKFYFSVSSKLERKEDFEKVQEALDVHIKNIIDDLSL
jgi:phosphoglucomutase